MGIPPIQIDERDDEIRIPIPEGFNGDAIDTFLAALRSCEPAGRPLVLDLTDLRYIESSGLGMLLIARDFKPGAKLVLRGASGPVARTLATLNFDVLFNLD